jgi:hypothetical protein
MAKPLPLGLTVAQYEIKTQEQPFNMKLLYVMLHEWFIEKQYVNDKDTDFPEISYYEARHEHGKEVWVKWRFKYAPQGNKFYRRVFNIDLHGLGMTQLEVVQDNKKYRMDRGEFWFSCHAILEIDYEKKWRNSPLLKPFLNTFWKRFIWKDLEKHRKEIYRDAYEIHNLVKQYLEIKRAVPMLKTFWPPKGIKTQLE